MKAKVTKQFLHDRLGLCKVGQIIDLPESQIQFFSSRKAIEVYATKVVEETPIQNVEVVVDEKPTRKRKTKSAP